MFYKLVGEIFDAVERNNAACVSEYAKEAAFEYGRFTAYVDTLEDMGHVVVWSEKNQSGCVSVGDFELNGRKFLDDGVWTEDFKVFARLHGICSWGEQK